MVREERYPLTVVVGQEPNWAREKVPSSLLWVGMYQSSILPMRKLYAVCCNSASSLLPSFQLQTSCETELA